MGSPSPIPGSALIFLKSHIPLPPSPGIYPGLGEAGLRSLTRLLGILLQKAFLAAPSFPARFPGAWGSA